MIVSILLGEFPKFHIHVFIGKSPGSESSLKTVVSPKHIVSETTKKSASANHKLLLDKNQ